MSIDLAGRVPRADVQALANDLAAGDSRGAHRQTDGKQRILRSKVCSGEGRNSRIAPNVGARQKEPVTLLFRNEVDRHPDCTPLGEFLRLRTVCTGRSVERTKNAARLVSPKRIATLTQGRTSRGAASDAATTTLVEIRSAQ